MPQPLAHLFLAGSSHDSIIGHAVKFATHQNKPFTFKTTIDDVILCFSFLQNCCMLGTESVDAKLIGLLCVTH